MQISKNNQNFAHLTLEILFNESPFGIYMVDGDFLLRQANSKALLAFGDIPDLIGRDFDEVMHILWPKKKAEEIIRHFHNTLETGTPYIVSELVEERVDRGIREFYEWQIHRISFDNGSYGVVCYFRDISQLILVREAIEKNNKDLQQFASIVESSNDAIISKDLKGIIASWNKGAERIFGYKAEEVIGKPVNMLIPMDRQNEEPEILKRIMRGERIDHYDTIRQHKDGKFIHISLTISPIKDLDGVIIGASKIGRDITSRKKDEEDLKRFTSILEDRVTERTQLLEEQAGRLRQLAVELTEVEQSERRRLAEVLHDHLQQYLVAAKMRLDLIESKVGSTDKNGFQEARSYIEKAVDASRQLTAELRPPVLYEGGLNAGLSYLAKKIEEQHKLHVHLSIRGNIEPGADSIKIMIYQCVQELLLNTVKYAKVAECFVIVNRLESNMIQIVVEDKGIGFNISNLGKTNKGGFGLFSIRERMKAFGGEFKVASIPGHGALFTLIIPDKEIVSVEGEKDIEEKVVIKRKSGKEGITVLIAEDHPIIRQAMASLLISQPFIKEVIEAENGEEAIKKAEENDPDVILMDINMPLMNGIEATRILTHKKSRSQIIGLSVLNKSEMAQAMMDVGAVAYFNKGDDTNNLIATIKELGHR